MAARLPRLGVSNDGRILVTGKGKPFFWLGDTAWELFQRLDRRETAKYLGTRARQRFTLIQAVVLAEFDGLHTPNRYGEKPLVNDDPERPNEKYMRHVDWVIRSADRLGLYIGVLPTWGDKVNEGQWGTGPVVFNEAKAHAWGKYLGNRWREETNLVWILGGDRIPVYEGHDYRALWRAMAAGIDAGSGQRALKTYHPSGGSSSSQWLHGEPWLDVNMMQSGHGGGHDVPVWEWIERDRALVPAKPVLDGEPNYEDHPVNPWPKWDPRNGYFRDWDVRKQLYRSVFAGGCGATYGHHFVWQMWAPGREAVNNGNELIAWRDAIQRPGARQVRHLAELMASRPTRTRIADQGLLVSDAGTGGDHVRAMRDAEGAWAFVYLPTPRAVTVNLKRLGGRMVRVRWLDPVDGTTIELGRMDADAERSFTPPGDRPDRVLVVDRLA